jgi:RNA polymerase sigma-70 factor (ECF subfamily)
MESTPASLLRRLGHMEDVEAWVRFVRLYTPFLYEWTGRLRLQPHDAADLVQDIFVTLLRVLPQFNYDEHGNFRGWLYRVAVNKWKDGRKKRIEPALGNGAAGAEPAFDDPIEEWTEADFRKQILQRALDLLRQEYSPANWQAFWATTIEGQPVAKVAIELQLTANAIYLTRARIIRRLREELEGMID